MSEIKLDWKIVKEYTLPGKPIVNTLYDSRFPDEGIFEYIDFPNQDTKYLIEKVISFKIPNKKLDLFYHIKVIPKEFNLPSQYKDYISECYTNSFRK